jgi:hypothetical protein
MGLIPVRFRRAFNRAQEFIFWALVVLAPIGFGFAAWFIIGGEP